MKKSIDSTQQFFKIVRVIKGNKQSEAVQIPKPEQNPFMKLNSVLKDLDKLQEANKLQSDLDINWSQSISYFQSRAVEACKGIRLESQSQTECLNTAQTMVRGAIEVLVKIYRDVQMKKLLESQKIKMKESKQK